ncbi:hypothetical protein ACQKFO_21715 [Rossellomorea sp. NPDC071047]|uniref:hypothetical protein n=1 Tax=Rossellomorea sp. NPDC071047 TaxID=3390675 RepID=UPI003D055F90
MVPTREKVMNLLAENYYYFLHTLPYDNKLYMEGMREARGKFLANLHISLLKNHLPYKHKERFYSTDYVSLKALELLQNKNWNSNELRYEHMIPKKRYIQDQCEEWARGGLISKDKIYNLLIKYFWTATIHKDEDALLSRTKMPDNWDKSNIFSRYEDVGIELLSHNKEYFLNEN